ncbi:glycosyltransferase family 4 protein [Nonlabens sp.]|jgi:glycosyltransferase involved in cell wall biosynthesis|uniref:glycosyltransferase family 4 protein n=1 Tax=Nonlabens sp. TaxID=1888209 RepID=UPI003F6956E6
MHIAFLTPEYPDTATGKSGGLGTSIKNIAIALQINGVKISVIVPYQDKTEVIERNGITLFKIKKENYPIANWYFYKKKVSKTINVFIKEYQIDLIEAPDWTGITAFMKLDCPISVRLNGSDAYFCHIDGRPQKKKNFLLEKLNFKNAAGLLSASSFTAQITKKVFQIDREFTIIHNAIDDHAFLPQDKEVENQILYFGTCIRKKGVLDLAQAFNLLIEKRSQTELLFLGKDTIDYKENKSTIELIKKALTQKAIQNTRFIKEVPYQEVHDYLAAATVICLPSYAEAYPMTWLEAMSMEKALVTSDIGWAKEMMVHEQTGFMVHPSKHSDLADHLYQFLEDKNLRAQMGKNARQRVQKHFSTEVIVKQNISYYKNLLT